VNGPVVGIVGNAHVVPRHFGELPVAGTPTAYVERVARSGARPVVLPAVAALDLLDVVDALVLTGGGDVDPARYGSAGGAQDVDPARDEVELALVRAAHAAGLPLLGVCRGLQIMAVAYGGTLVRGLDHIHPGTGHLVHTRVGSLTAGLLGPSVRTTAFHRQAVSAPGTSWRATAWAEDEVVEAIEWVGGDWPALGVQWHPEHDDPTGPAIFAWIAEAARERRARVTGRGLRPDGEPVRPSTSHAAEGPPLTEALDRTGIPDMKAHARRRRVARVTLACGVLAATTLGCGSSTGEDGAAASPTAGRTTAASGVSYTTRVNALCTDLLVKVTEVNGGGGGHPGHFPLEEYLAEQPRLTALITQFDAKADLIPVTAADRQEADALHAFQRLSDRATAMLDAAAATGEQEKFDAAYGAVHQMLDESSVPTDLLAQGIVCNAR
jgi:putative glutamine amidotransferase